ncbi:HD domain-containing protein [Tumebacillus sp. DT12]|uniref:HD domain-containing protein n=1 Tax=Tumebacillus lacus TaxID=2995335 RepID=A0ABT3X6V3_9BACL|nr:HD domain-containing protein [Tumebacillus lacus]MCX7572171.1 HD domain-containing protein [Tumebacillus lacus]
MAEWKVDKEKVFKDPVHDYIYVTDGLIWDLINTRAFQRLRRIRQLGTSFLTYHGAEHSRFTHSLGTYETMRKVLSHFEKNHGWPQDLRTKRLALCAALLHDIGHGPFSHTIEQVFKTHHETWTQRILVEDPDILAVLTEHVDAEFAQDVADVIAKKKHPLVVNLISSQLDVDRMDYLLRDAVHTGVTYGTFELERLIRIMKPDQDGVVVKKKGMHTVEQYILARYFMYSQVYLHPVTIGSDVLLRRIFSRAKKLHDRGDQLFMPEELRPFFENRAENVSVKEYLEVDESVVMYTLERWTSTEDAILRDLADRFVNRRLFGAVQSKELKEVEREQIREMFRSNGLNPDYYLEFHKAVAGGYQLYSQGIKLVDDEGRKTDISQDSGLVRSLQPETKYRIYCPKEVLRGEGRYKPIRGWMEAFKI